MKTGNKLKLIRKQKGYSQEEMSEKMNMSQQAYSRLENDQKNLGHDEVKKIAEVFGTTAESIDNWDGTFVFNNFGETTNGQIQTQNNVSDEEKNLTKALIDQLREENEVLKEEVVYLKTVIDRLLKG